MHLFVLCHFYCKKFFVVLEESRDIFEVSMFDAKVKTPARPPWGQDWDIVNAKPSPIQITTLWKLASCLINAQPLPAHRPTADDNSLTGCTRPLPDRWLVAAQCPFCWQPMPILLLVWVRSLIEPDVLKTVYHSTIPLRFIWSICSGN